MMIGHYSNHIAAHGGAETYLRRIAAAQKSAGHTVYYFSKYGQENCLDGIPIVKIETEKALYTKAKQLNLDILHLHARMQTVPPADLAVVRTVHGNSAYCPSGSKFLARKSCPCDRAYSITGCLWGHFVDRCGSIRPHQVLQNFRDIRSEQQVLSHIPSLANSEFTKEQMIALGYPQELIQTLYLCVPEVETVASLPQNQPPRFLFVGRFDVNKGLTWLIKAVSQVTVSIQLEIAGDGDQAPELRSLVQSLGLSDRVTFHGWLPSEAVYTLMQSSRALVLPSLLHEPAGLVAYEAMMNARAVIASRVGGIPEGVVEGVTGLLVEPNDVADLTQSIERLATDWTLAKQLGETGRTFARERFGVHQHIKQLTQIYERTSQMNCSSLSSSHPNA